MMKTKKILSLLLTAVMVLSLCPAFTLTASADVSIQTGLPDPVTVAAMENQSQYNTSDQPLNGDVTTVAFGGKLWKVIGYKPEGGEYNGVLDDGGGALPTADSYMTLLLANGSTYNDNVQFHGSSNVYNTSNLKTQMEDAYGALSDEEKDLVLPRDLATGTYSVTMASWCDGVGTTQVDNAHFWPLSTREASYVPTSVRAFNNSWWLRSPGYFGGDAAYVDRSGDVNDDGYYVDLNPALRPAFNLNLTSVLFTSAATGGKSSATVGSGLIGAAAPDEKLKFTVLDNTMNLDVPGTSSITKGQGETFTIPYINATPGTNHYVSGVLVDENDEVKYYGKFADASSNANGDAVIKLPADIPIGEYTLKLFTEQCNGDNFTDFASNPVEIELTVTEPKFGLKPGADLSGTKVYFGEYSGGDSAGPIMWHVVDTGNNTATLWTTTSMGNRRYDPSQHNNWSGSEICAWLNGTGSFAATGFLPTAFHQAEQDAIAQYSTTEETGYNTSDKFTPNQKIVLPSVAEMGNGTGTGTWNISQNVRQFSRDWWLRSPGDDALYAAFVLSFGYVNVRGSDVISNDAIRPAFNLDLTSVIFTSAATGGKSSVDVGDGLIGAAAPAAELKFTVLDNTINTPDLVLSGSTNGTGEISFGYSGATTGTNQYISCVLEDTNGDIVYYGKLADCTDTGDASGDFTLDLDGVDKDETYTLKIFGEQANDDYETDFAGMSKNFTLTVEASGNGTAVCAGAHIPGAAATCTTAQTCTVCGYEIAAALTHDWDLTVWANDGTNHWHTCKNTGCTEKHLEAIHIPGAAATCTTAQTCTICGYEIAAALTHDWDLTVWANDGTNHWRTCKNTGCTEKHLEAAHEWSEWSVTTPATTSTPGEETRACSICDETEMRPIAQLTRTGGGSSYLNPPTSSQKSGTVVINSIVTLSTTYTDGKIYYTTDGKAPTSSSTLYDKPIVIDKDMTINVIVISGGKTSSTATFTYTARAAKISFKDKASETQYMKSHGKLFDPDMSITRYEMLAALSLLLDIEKVNTDKTFSDVSGEYKDLITLFAGAGIIGGFPDGSFGGEKALTRAEFVKIMSIILGLDIKEGTSKFDDMAGHWADIYIAEFEKLGYVKGYSDNQFMPDRQMTRAEFVAILNRIIGVKAVSAPPVFEDLSSGHWAYGDIMAVYL